VREIALRRQHGTDEPRRHRRKYAAHPSDGAARPPDGTVVGVSWQARIHVRDEAAATLPPRNQTRASLVGDTTSLTAKPFVRAQIGNAHLNNSVLCLLVAILTGVLRLIAPSQSLIWGPCTLEAQGERKGSGFRLRLRSFGGAGVLVSPRGADRASGCIRGRTMERHEHLPRGRAAIAPPTLDEGARS
jgi:hypothetical protein